MASTIDSSSLAKHLASSNEKTRNKALRLLKTWLPSQTQLPEDELRRIWKGLFYCMWHADKQQYQLQLINRLSFYLVSLDLSLSIQYFETFVLTIRREWSGIDYLRLDKFYLLIRRFLHNLFMLMKKNLWDLGLVSRLMGVLDEKSLLSADKYPAQGVNYHLAGIFLEELKKFLPIKLEVVEVLVKPFVSVMGKSLDKVLLSKIKGSLFGCLLENGKKLLERRKAGEGSEEGNADDEVELFGAIALNLGLSRRFFELGSSEDCVQGNRKVLFGMHEVFSKLEKDLASLGIIISIPEVRNEVYEDVVSELISITEVEKIQEVANGATEKSSKKKIKKAKKASGGSESGGKKSKRRRSLSSTSEAMESENENTSNGENLKNDEGVVNLNETVISNLQMQFEKIAAEVGMDTTVEGTFDSPAKPVSRTVQKKRKRAKSIDGQVFLSEGGVGGSAVGKSGEKSAKKVRFSMKNNVVWKPHSPLPPQSLRLPPSATPRGSALKKGIPAGPVIEAPTMGKKMKRKNGSLKKTRKGLKSVSPSVKRLKKLRSYSA